MSSLIQRIETDNIRVEILADDSAINPREQHTENKIVCFHKRYGLANELDINIDDFGTWTLLREYLEEKFQFVYDIYMYDHGSIDLSFSSFNDRWDSGQIGFYCTNIDNYGYANLTLDEYKHYLNGDVYYYSVVELNSEDPDSEHRFYDFFGYDWEESGLKESLWHTLRYECDIEDSEAEEILKQIN